MYLAVNAPLGAYSPLIPLHNGVELYTKASGVNESVANTWTIVIAAGDRVACIVRSDENLNLRGAVPGGASFFSGAAPATTAAMSPSSQQFA
jgi:hypothetical protein